MSTKHPELLWAQRSSETDEAKNLVYLTISLPDIQEQTLDYNLTSTGLTFKAKTGNPAKGIPEQDWAFDIQFFEEINTEKSTKNLNSRALTFTLRKKEKKEEYWPRLTKEKIKLAFVKTDFSKWVDEDEQEGAAVDEDDGGMPAMPDMGGPGGMDFGGMGGPGGMDFEKMMQQMGGPGGAGGAGPSGSSADDDDDDSDDDGPPPLEDPAPAK